MFCVFLDVFKEAAIPYTIFILLCVLYIKFICLNKLVSREYGPSWRKDVLILTAHPDDECMFFTPTILNMRNEGHRLYIACLSKGDYYGNGEIRKRELHCSCKELGINDGHITIIDDSKLPDDPQKDWPLEDLGEKIVSVIQQIKPHTIITFDSGGVSGHANHKALFHAVRKLSEDGKLSKDVAVFTLQTTNLIRKYISWLDIPWSCLVQKFPTVFVCSPSQFLIGLKAMSCHESQMVWFRRLYLMFSRYMLINTLDEMIR